MQVIAQATSVPAWTEIDWSADVKDAWIGGRRLRYVDYGSGPAVLLIHGLGGSWQTWLNNIPTLGLSHRVVAVDLPGFGKSDPLPPPAEMSTHAEVLATLLEQLGIASTTVIGHSMGGIISLALLEARPDLVSRLVLADAGGIPLTPLRLAVIVNGFKAFDRVVKRPPVVRAIARRPRLRRIVSGGLMTRHDALRGPFAAEVVPAISAPGFVGALVAAGKVAGDVDPATVGCPVLLVWGADDRILPLTQARALCHSLPDARLTVIEHCGHCPMFEAPDEFNRAVLGFV